MGKGLHMTEVIIGICLFISGFFIGGALKEVTHIKQLQKLRVEIEKVETLLKGVYPDAG